VIDMVATHQLVAMMDQVQRSLGAPGGLHETLVRITATAKASIPNVDLASISIHDRVTDEIKTVAPTDALAEQLDAWQYELREGPCYEVIEHERGITWSTDVRREPRWPRFGPRAGDAGVRAQLAIQLHANGQTIGLNLYSGQVAGFEAPPDLAEMFAQHARAALGHAYDHDQLTAGMNSRTEIGIAIGLLMARYQLDRQRAFEFLVRLSQTGNTKLRDVAAQIVDLGAGNLD